ncbi:MAG: glycerol-3-phosphate dehydrogenase/oxidase [Xanthomonadaceae bacterium]|nr:glycerol-3-phosphate dehydrogenase/oxidase [Xanthomonadaceae bacterium]
MPDLNTPAFPMIRNIAALREGPFDLLVIGGGIYGSWTACDAAQRGLKVALIERSDWGAGTSQSSSKLIHGGLRYLEHYEFALVRHALAERRVLSRLAPHLVRPLNFVVPVWKGARVGRMQLLAGLTLYDFLATGKQPVPRFKSFSRRKLLAAHPYLDETGLKGGLRYGDCQEDDARMTLFVVAAAQAAGAVCANAVTADELLFDGDRCVGAALRDTETGQAFPLRASCVVNAAGPWAHRLPGTTPPAVKLVKGVHLVLPAIPGLEDAFLLTAPSDGRVFFVIPWNGRTLVGTTESQVADATGIGVDDAETGYLLDAVNALMPGLRWTADDIIGRFAGVRSLQAEDAESLAAVSREFAVLTPRPGLVWPLGGKYTTARCDAVEIVDRVFDSLGKPAVDSRTARVALPGAPQEVRELGDFTGWQQEAISGLARRGFDAETARSLTLRHGTGIRRVEALIDENPAWSTRIHPDVPYLRAEVVLAVRDEMARTVDDVVRRRMPLSLVVHDAPAWRATVAELMAEATTTAAAQA